MWWIIKTGVLIYEKSKNIYLGLLFISVLFFNNDVVLLKSLTEFYTETECRYENNKGNY